MGSEARLGKISSIDYPAGMVRVVYHEKDDDVTRMIPLLSPIHYGEYSMPEVGDQVLILHLSNGTEAGVVLGRPWSEKNKPPEGFAGLYRKDYSHKTGQALERYDAKKEEYSQSISGTMDIKPTERWTLNVGASTVEVNKDGSVSITAPNGVTIDTPQVTVTGDVVAGGVSLQKHTHGGDSGGTTTKPI